MPDDRYSILFEPVRIGPKTTKNRFYQVPHCNGSGFRWPRTMAHLRGMKAEGGWGVVCTEECEIHPSSDMSGFVEMRLWDDSDIPTHRLMTQKVHEHGALAGIQLVHNGAHATNRFTRTPGMSPSGGAVKWVDAPNSVAMSKRDIRVMRRWFREAALRARKAEYDIVYVYAAHDMTVLSHFLQSRYNQRTDEYGGCLENRVRFLREVLEETREAVGDSCAVALRFAVDESDDANLRFDREGREVVEMLAELPDLWDVNISGWPNDSLTSRFGESGHQEKYIEFVKQVTTKPVVGVGRFTSPDAMLSQIRRGVLDFIGAARPSIADPFLPRKIQEGRVEEIRECIGCNICTTGDDLSVPIRCTQNPTMGEEWRKGWHPEKIEPAASTDKVLVVGGGPAGLECTLALSKRGYDVVLAEKGAVLGGRILLEADLPGLSEWRRVTDHRTYMIGQKSNVESYLESELDAAAILEYGFEHVVVATGSVWRTDCIGRSARHAISCEHDAGIVSVDDLLRGAGVAGKVAVYDDDHYYMANVLAEKLIREGCEVVYVTSAAVIAPFTSSTLEQHRVQRRLLELGVEIVCGHTVSAVGKPGITLNCIYTGRARVLECDVLLPVTTRLPVQDICTELGEMEDLAAYGIKSVQAIGDGHAPGTIAAAVYSGHQYARQLDNPVDLRYEFPRENIRPGVQ